MDLREEFEGRVKKLENLIENKGLGSKQLKKARKVQKRINAVVFLGSIISVAGIALWALKRN